MVIARRHAAIFCLNMAQGLPGSFFAIGLPALLRQERAGLDTVALTYLIWAPWALKFIWGPLIDRRAGWFAAIFGRPALPFVPLRQPVRTAGAQAQASRMLRDPAPLLALMMVSDLATGTDVLLTARLIDTGSGPVAATFLLNTLGVTVPMTWLGARLLQRLGGARAMALMLAAKCLLLGLSLPGLDARVVTALAVASVVVSSVIAIGYWQLYMRHVRPGQTATGIGLLTSIRVGLIMVGGIGGGQLAARLGYGPVFLGAAALMLVAVLLVMRLKGDASCGCTA